MKRFTEILSGSAAVLFQVALTGWMFAMSEINFDFVIMELNYVLLSAMLLAAYFINLALLRRGLPVPLLAAAELALVAAGAVAFVKGVYLEPFQLRTVIINCVVYCLGFGVAAFLAWNPTNRNGILLRFDALAAMSVVMLVLDALLYMPGAAGALRMCWLCMALTVLASVSMSSGALAGRGGAVEGSSSMGRILLALVVALVGILALVVIFCARGGFDSFSHFLLSLLNAIASGAKAVFLYLYGLLERLVLWLSQFADDTPMEALPMEQGGVPEMPAGEQGEMALPRWAFIVPATLTAAVLVYIIFKLRKVRAVGMPRRAVAQTAARRKNGAGKALRELWGRLCAEVRFRWNCLRYRRSPAGLLVWCEKKAPGGRSRGESGERFLRRLGGELGGEPGEALEALAELVERSFYSPASVTVPAGLYRTVRGIRFKK